MAALTARAAASEGSYFHAENRAGLLKRVERMVGEGLLPKSALIALEQSTAASGASLGPGSQQPNMPPPVRLGRPAGEYVYNHVQTLFPVPKPSGVDRFKLGTSVSFGRARWTSDGASIFSVADGKRLAQTPVKEPTLFERLRAEKLNRASLETPLVNGYRLLPIFTPGRALMWGTILAVWGTAAATVTVSRQLGINRAEDAPGALEAIFRPFATFVRERLEPYRALYALPGSRGVEPPEIAIRLRNAFRER